MNFSQIPHTSFVGKWSRIMLRILPPSMQMPIFQGKLRGRKWIIGSSEHGCWLGSYEWDKQKLFERTVLADSVVYDIGANVGFYTLLSSVLVGTKGHVYSFEPLPRNIEYLKLHLSINTITNVSVIEAAVSYHIGIIKFVTGTSSGTGRIDASCELTLRAISLDDLWLNGKLPPPNFIKIDIEGSELLALHGAERLLRASSPTIFLATHGEAIHKQCCDFLISLGYYLSSIGSNGLAQSNEIFAVNDSAISLSP